MARPRLHRKALKKRDIDASLRACGAGRRPTRDIFLWDGAEHGLGVKITPAGSAVFILQKTVRRRLRRMTLGKYGDMTLEDARREARRLNGLIATNHDPVAEERAAQEEAERQASQEKTMRDLWSRYEVEIVAANKPRTAAEKRRMWARRIEPAIGKRKIKDVTELDVSEIVRAPQYTDKAGRVRGKGEAGNLYRLLNHMFSRAIAWRMRPRELGTPLENLPEPKVERRTRLLNSGEVAALLKELDRSHKAAPGRSHVFAAIKLLLLTGARVTEILTLRWEDVDVATSELHLRDTKTGQSDRPVSAEALAVIREIKHLPGSPYVFRSALNPKIPLSYSTIEAGFQDVVGRAGVKNCTLHTLRHWFATQTANSVNNPRVGMKLTGHKSLASYMNYIQAEKEQAHELAQKLGALTGELVASAPAVVPLSKKARA